MSKNETIFENNLEYISILVQNNNVNSLKVFLVQANEYYSEVNPIVCIDLPPRKLRITQQP